MRLACGLAVTLITAGCTQDSRPGDPPPDEGPAVTVDSQTPDVAAPLDEGPAPEDVPDVAAEDPGPRPTPDEITPDVAAQEDVAADVVVDVEPEPDVPPCDDPTDTDADGVPDCEDVDIDGDGVDNDDDCAPYAAATAPGLKEVCDGVDNNCDDVIDEAPEDAEEAQAGGFWDTDQDGALDCVDLDDDEDLVSDFYDNCPLQPNPGQADADNDGVGNVCDGDEDGDGIKDESDNCPLKANPEQDDVNADGVGDLCDDVCGPIDNKTGWTADQSSWWLMPWGNECDGKAANMINGLYELAGGNWAACEGPVSPRNFYSPSYTLPNVGEWFVIDFGEGLPLEWLTLTQAAADGYVSGISSPAKFTALVKGALVQLYDAEGVEIAVIEVEFPQMPTATVSMPGLVAHRIRVTLLSFWGSQTNPAAWIMELDITDNPDCAGPQTPPDTDGDGVDDEADEFDEDADEWGDADKDEVGDNEDPDDDNDGIEDPDDANPLEDLGDADTDEDGTPDATDEDDDDDGAPDTADAFPLDPTEQLDTDGDGIGDNTDNCPVDHNPDQTDYDEDGKGDACDPPPGPGLCEPAAGPLTPFNTEADAQPSCAALQAAGNTESGRYWIDPGGGAFIAWCDMSTDGGGWTLLASYLTTTAPAVGLDATSTEDHFRLPYEVTAQLATASTSVRFSCKQAGGPVYLDLKTSEEQWLHRPYAKGDGCTDGFLWKPDTSLLEPLQCTNYPVVTATWNGSCCCRADYQLDIYAIGMPVDTWMIGDYFYGHWYLKCAGKDGADFMRMWYR